MLNVKKYAGLLALVWIMAGTTLHAQGLKIGYTNAEAIISQMQEYRTVMQQLKTLADAGQTEYGGLLQTYQDKLADYQKKQALLSNQAKQNRESELVKMQGDIQQFAANKERELGQKEAELLQPLLDKIQKAIDEVAAEKGLSLVLNTQVAGTPFILYAEESMNITEDVATKLGITKSTGAASSR